MKNLNNKLQTGLAILTLATIGNLTQAQPASAQLLDIATGALKILGLRGQQPAPQLIQPPAVYPQNRSTSFGTDNFNGNSVNLCITGCLPRAAAPRPTTQPVFVPQQRPVGIPQQGSFSSTTVRTQAGNLPPGAVVRPGVPVPPQAVPPRTATVPPRPQPRRPVLTIPPISLPFNL